MEFDHFNITRAEGVITSCNDEKRREESCRSSKGDGQERRGFEERCDTPTTPISREQRGSALAAKGAAREDGKGEEAEE